MSDFDSYREQMGEDFDSSSIDTMFAFVNRYRVAPIVDTLNDIHGMFLMGQEL